MINFSVCFIFFLLLSSLEPIAVVWLSDFVSCEARATSLSFSFFLREEGKVLFCLSIPTCFMLSANDSLHLPVFQNRREGEEKKEFFIPFPSVFSLSSYPRSFSNSPFSSSLYSTLLDSPCLSLSLFTFLLLRRFRSFSLLLHLSVFLFLLISFSSCGLCLCVFQRLHFYEYPSMSKQLGGFRLRVEKGQFSDSEILVMLGQNGTGKSTFIRYLHTHTDGQIQDRQIHRQLQIDRQTPRLSTTTTTTTASRATITERGRAGQTKRRRESVKRKRKKKRRRKFSFLIIVLFFVSLVLLMDLSGGSLCVASAYFFSSLFFFFSFSLSLSFLFFLVSCFRFFLFLAIVFMRVLPSRPPWLLRSPEKTKERSANKRTKERNRQGRECMFFGFFFVDLSFSSRFLETPSH